MHEAKYFCKIGYEAEQEEMWETVAEDFDTLMKIAASIKVPELHVKFIIVSCVVVS
jgi:hypothetical protein